MTDAAMTDGLNWLQRLVVWVAGRVDLAAVRAIPPGRANDGMVLIDTSGTSLDRQWSELLKSYESSREAWRVNPMVRRMVGLTTSYVVGAGIQVSSDTGHFNSFIREFWNDPHNRMDIRLHEWCNELTRSGELFPVLFTNPADGMSYVRLIPADFIKEVDFDSDDYERELRYRELTPPGTDEKWWYSPEHPSAAEPKANGELTPWMLHYAVNRPAGTVRGESDLWPLLPWAKRYEGWLGDRVSLNAAMRSFYWVVYAARHLKQTLVAKYRLPPASGSIVVAEEGAEKWEAVTPNLGARDAKEDGRAIRWMIASGGLGTSLSDFGEGEDSGLTRGADSSEQRRRFLLQRQRYFCYMLSDLLVKAYNRRNATVTGKRKYNDVTTADVICKPPDISVEDNSGLATAATTVMDATTKLKGLVGETEELRRLGLRLFVKFIGESISDKEFESLMEGDPAADAVAAAEIATIGKPVPGGEGSGGNGKEKPKPKAKEGKGE